MIIVGNAFSLSMLSDFPAEVQIHPATCAEVAEALRNGALSVIGHDSTANILSLFLGVEVRCNRVTVKLAPGDVLYVAQYAGPRLPEGCTVLPEGASFTYLRVVVR